MKEKILLFLKTKLQGVADNYLNGVADFYSKAITDESQIETTLTDGVIELLKVNASILQTEGDRRATEAQKTAIKNFMEKNGLDENGQPKKKAEQKKDESSTDGSIPEWFKSFQQEQLELKEKLNGYEKEKTTAQITGKITAKLKEKGIPESYYKGRNLLVNDETGIDELVNSIDTDFVGFKQELAESGVIISVPKSSSAGAKEGELLGEQIAEKRNSGTSEGVPGKKIV